MYCNRTSGQGNSCLVRSGLIDLSVFDILNLLLKCVKLGLVFCYTFLLMQQCTALEIRYPLLRWLIFLINLYLPLISLSISLCGTFFSLKTHSQELTLDLIVINWKTAHKTSCWCLPFPVLKLLVKIHPLPV